MTAKTTWESWGEEFGYNVETHGFLIGLGFEDSSYLNDAAPSFTKTVGDGLIVIWIDHKDPEQRELPEARLTITFHSDDEAFERVIWSGESWIEFAKQLRAAL